MPLVFLAFGVCGGAPRPGWADSGGPGEGTGVRASGVQGGTSPGWRTWLRIALLLVLGIGVLGQVTRAGTALWARMTTPAGGAQWIWAERSRTDVSPAAFYAVRDFDLNEPPARARLLILADPEYVLTLNGRRIGSGRYPPGGPVRLDTYEVGPLLLPGGNRLLVELRSDRGAGGFLAVLQDGDGSTLVRTDSDWRIVPRHRFGLVRGLLPLERKGGLDGTPAFSWGAPPTGRWGRPEAGPRLPLQSEVIQGPAIPAATVSFPVLPQLASTSVRHVVLFDWGREMTGNLVLLMPAGDGGAGGDGLRPAILFTGTQIPDPLSDVPAGTVLVMRGRRSWMDAEARRFRYAMVILESPLGARAQEAGAIAARVLPVDPKKAAGRIAYGAVTPLEGVFGLNPPPLRPPVQDEIWRKLQSVARGGARKKP